MRDRTRGGGDDVGRWAGGLAAVLLLALATSAAAFQQPANPVTTTAAPPVAGPAATSTTGPKTYDECLRTYAGRTNATAVCQRLFPNAAPAATSTTTPPASTSEPVDISPLNKLIDALKNRPKTQPKSPTDPLAVIPDIQAACAAYASVPERWRRCVADAWSKTGLGGEPPLVLQNPPVVETPPVQPPVVQPSPVQPPVQPPVVQSKPPVRTPAPLTPETVAPEPVRPAPEVVPAPPPAAIVAPTPGPPPVVVPPPPPKPPATPVWFWLAALVAVAGAGFGAARLLNRARSRGGSKVSPAPCPDIALVADPGVVVLTPDGPPRAGMAVSLHVEPDADGGRASLDYPSLETTP